MQLREQISWDTDTDDAHNKFLSAQGVLKQMQAFWNHKTVRDLWENKHNAYISVQDSLAYFMEGQNFDRIFTADYVPSKNDVLHVRARTTGIVEETFIIKNRKFLIVDVGGQRSERKKWIKCFSAVTGIIFVVSLQGYKETLFEDDTTGRMTEALKVFQDVLGPANAKVNILKNASLILFFNKWDLFKEQGRLDENWMQSTFPDYVFYDKAVNERERSTEGQINYAYNFIKGKFLEKNTDPNRKIYVHQTCATDTNTMRNIFDAVNHTIINRALVKAGLLVA